MKTNLMQRNGGQPAPILLSLLVGLMFGLPAPNAAWSATNWRYTGSMSTARWLYPATLLPDGRVLVAGGQDASSEAAIASAELYDPATGTWSSAGSMNEARWAHTATLLPDGKVLVAGGGLRVAVATASAELYDPATGTWSYTGSMNEARSVPTATLLRDGRVLVCGGASNDGPSAELYDPATGTWSYTGNMNFGRDSHAATLLLDGTVLAVGGYGASASAELYDPATGSWSTTGNLNDARAWLTATLLPDGNVLAAGSETGGSTLASAELYDPTTGAWTYAGSMSDARGDHTATLLPDGSVLVAGGCCDLSSTELYDPATGTWTSAGSMNTARVWPTATLLPDGRVLVAGGGSSSRVSFASAELYVQGIPLPVALNATNLVWTTGGNAAWVGQTNVTHDGAAAAQSGTVTDAQESWLQTTVTGPGVVAFWWKVSSEGDCDFLEFYVGGALQSRISGEVDWQRVAFAVPAGSQTLRWRYAKDVGTDLGGDAGSVDEVVFAPSSDGPVILLQPASLVVVTGATVNLRVSAAGSATLGYQWFRDATNALSGAISATLTLANVQLTNAGDYSVVVTNLQGTATSSSALLAVTTNGPVNNVLLFFDSPLASPYQNALSNQARAYQLFGPDGELAFNQAIAAADPGGTLVVVDSAWRSHNFDSVRSFVQAGGRAILQYVYLGGSSAAADFQATVAATLSAPQPVYDWGGTTLFAGLSSPLNFVKGFFLDDGQQLQPTAGGQAVAGFTSSASANQAAVVIGNARRTLVNGFILEEASPSANGVRLAQNEIDFLAGAAQPTPPFFTLQPRSQTVVLGAKATFSPLVSGTGPCSYQWLKNGTNLLGITSATCCLTNVQPEQAGDYQVVVTNLYGAVTSSVAALTLTLMGPVESILLYCDGAASNPYQSALQALGRPIQLFNINQEQGFSLAIGSADPGKTLAIVDWANQGPQTSGLDTFANAGGRAILSIWYLTNSVSLPAAFGASVVQTYTTPMPVYDWGGSPFFTGVSSPLSLVESGFNVDGQRLQPTANGQAVAGYTSVAAGNQAALVIGNSGRTILNGFLLEDANSAAAMQLAKNEIQFLLELGMPQAPSLITQPQDQFTVVNGTATFAVNAWGSPPLSYQWRFEGTNLVGATNSVLILSNVTASQAGPYSVVVTNAFGVIISSDATLTVSDNIARSGTAIIGTQNDVKSGSPVPYYQAGVPTYINDGDYTTHVDTWNGTTTSRASYVGITWTDPVRNTIVELDLTMACFLDGGWFGVINLGPGPGGALTPNMLTAPTIQVSTNGGAAWTDISHTSDYTNALTGFRIGGGANPNPDAVTVHFTNAPVSNINGIRIIGREGGTASGGFLGVFELAVRAAAKSPPPIPELPGSAITTPGGVPTFKFTPPAGYKYRMVWKNQLTDATWTPLGDWSPTSTGAEMTLTDTTAGGQPHRFYRLEASNP